MLPISYRMITATAIGVGIEICFTALKSGSLQLEGHTQMWVMPLYAGGYTVFEKIHDGIREWPVAARASVYASFILGMEYAGGMFATYVTGSCPWEYTAPLAVHGVINLAYAPLWGTVGLLAEKAHDLFLRLELHPSLPAVASAS